MSPVREDIMMGAAVWDTDGPGPEPARVATTSFVRDSAGNRYAKLGVFSNGQWLRAPGPTSTSDGSVYGSVLAWDPDGDGQSPTLLVVEKLMQSFGPTRILLFDGTSFVQLGGEFDKVVDTLCAVDHDGDPSTPSTLYVGGLITSNAGTPTRYIARWNGSAWEPVGGGLESFARFMVAWDPDGSGPQTERLVVAGEFIRAGGQAAGDGSIPAVGIAIWDGTTWTALPQPIEFATSRGALRPWLQALTTWDPDGSGPTPSRVVAGGAFHTPDLAIHNLVIWDGVTMSGIAPTNAGRAVWGLAEFDHDLNPQTPNRLVVVSGPDPTSHCDQVDFWDGNSFEPVGQGVLSNGVGMINCLPKPQTTESSAGLLLVGSFDGIGDVVSQNMIEWNGRGWGAPGPGITPVRGLSGGSTSITQVPPVSADGLTSLVLTGASFRDRNGTDFAALAQWDGAWWRPVDQEVFHKATAMVLWDRDGAGPLPSCQVVAGSILGPGGWDIPVVYRLDPTGWIRLGDGPTNLIAQLITWDHDGDPQTPDILVSRGTSRNSLERFDGDTWTRMPLPSSATPRQMCVADLDGSGPARPQLFVACNGSVADSVRVFTSPDTPSQTVGNGLTGLTYYPRYIVAPTCYQLLSWDQDGPGPGRAKLCWFGLPVQGFNTYGSYAMQWNGQAWAELTPSAGSMGRAVMYRPDGPAGAQALAGFSIYGSISVYRSGHWTSLGDFSSAFLTPWDLDGPGPQRECLAIFGLRDATAQGTATYGVHVYVDSPIPWLARSPADTTAAQDNTITLVAAPAWGYAERAEGLRYKWRRNGLSLDDGPGGASPGGGDVSGASGLLQGSRDLILTISGARRGDAGSYDLIVFNSCGSAASGVAQVDIIPTCLADLDDSGTLDQHDIDVFLWAYEFGDPSADLDRDGGIEPGDLAAFFESYAAQCR